MSNQYIGFKIIYKCIYRDLYIYNSYIIYMNYIYLIQPRSSIEANLNVYKIGKTTRNVIKRLDEYEKGSELCFARKVVNCDLIETIIIKHLKTKFINRTDFGREYFEGNENEIMNEIYMCCNKNNNITSIRPIDDKIVTDIELLCNMGDIGFLQLYTNCMRDQLVCADKENLLFYLFNDITNLWQCLDQNDVALHFLKNIQRLAAPLINFYKKNEQYYTETKNIKQALDFKNKYEDIFEKSGIKSYSKAKNLVKLVSSELYESEFSKKLNKNKN